MKSRTIFSPPTNRRGAVLVVAMICTLLTAVILGTLLKIAVTRRQQSRAHVQALQAAWLAESGIERAVAQLAVNPDYPGETWQIPAKEFGGDYSGAVRIQVNPVEGQAAQRIIAIRADYPTDRQQRARKSKQIRITIPVKPSASPEETEK